MKTMNVKVKKWLVCHVDKIGAVVEAHKRAEFINMAKEVVVLESVPEGWEEVVIGYADQLRFGLRKESGKWNWKGSIEPYRVLATEAGRDYNKGPGWESAPWGYDLVLPEGSWNMVEAEVDLSKIGGGVTCKIDFIYSPEDMPEKVMLLERKLK